MIVWVMERYPPADDISPAEFEAFVAEVIRAAGNAFRSFEVIEYGAIESPDGGYRSHVSVRFRGVGKDYGTVIEANWHNDPISSELVRALHQKMMSDGATKALMVCAGRFQPSAVAFAFANGICTCNPVRGTRDK